MRTRPGRTENSHVKKLAIIAVLAALVAAYFTFGLGST